MKRKWIGRAAIFLLVSLILLLVLGWKPLAVRIAPKAVLYSALTKTIDQLQLRFAATPLAALYEIANPEGKYTAEISLRTSEDALDPSDYALKIQTDADKQQLTAEGTVVQPKSGTSFSCYLDTDFIAISTDKLGSGNYFGITYSSFLEDIQGISLLNFFISDKMLSQWDDSLQKLPSAIREIMESICFQRISTQDIDKCILGVLALPCKKERISLTAEEDVWNCNALTYSFNGKTINQFLYENPFPEDSEITVTFYLYKNQLVKTLVKYTALEQSMMLEGLIGMAPSVDDLCFTGTWRKNDTAKKYAVTVSAVNSNSKSVDHWRLQREEEGKEEGRETLQLSYAVDTGRVQLSMEGQGEPISFFLQKDGDGCGIMIEDLSGIIRHLDLQPSFLTKSEKLIAEIHLYRGSEIAKPQHKNLNEWSIEDFWTLLTSVGTLVGIQLFS